MFPLAVLSIRPSTHWMPCIRNGEYVPAQAWLTGVLPSDRVVMLSDILILSEEEEEREGGEGLLFSTSCLWRKSRQARWILQVAIERRHINAGMDEHSSSSIWCSFWISKTLSSRWVSSLETFFVLFFKKVFSFKSKLHYLQFATVLARDPFKWNNADSIFIYFFTSVDSLYELWNFDLIIFVGITFRGEKNCTVFHKRKVKRQEKSHLILNVRLGTADLEEPRIQRALVFIGHNQD